MGALLGQMELLQIGPTAEANVLGTGDAVRIKLQNNPHTYGANYYRVLADYGVYVRQGDSTVVATTSDLLVRSQTQLMVVTSNNTNNYLSFLEEDADLGAIVKVTRFEIDPTLHDRSALFAGILGRLTNYDASTNLLLINSAFTILFSARLTTRVSEDAATRTIVNLLSGSGGDTIIFGFNSVGAVVATMTDGESPSLASTDALDPLAGFWFDMALTFDGTDTISVYASKNSEGSPLELLSTTTQAGYTGVPGFLGARRFNMGGSFNGNIKNFRVMKGTVLTLAQLNAVRRTVALSGITPVGTWTTQYLFDYDFTDSIGEDDLVATTGSSPASIRFDAPGDLVGV